MFVTTDKAFKFIIKVGMRHCCKNVFDNMKQSFFQCCNLNYHDGKIFQSSAMIKRRK